MAVNSLFYIKKVKIIIIVIIIVVNNKNIITNIINVITFTITNATVIIMQCLILLKLGQYMHNNYKIKYILHYSN